MDEGYDSPLMTAHHKIVHGDLRLNGLKSTEFVRRFETQNCIVYKFLGKKFLNDRKLILLASLHRN